MNDLTKEERLLIAYIKTLKRFLSGHGKYYYLLFEIDKHLKIPCGLKHLGKTREEREVRYFIRKHRLDEKFLSLLDKGYVIFHIEEDDSDLSEEASEESYWETSALLIDFTDKIADRIPSHCESIEDITDINNPLLPFKTK